MNRSDQMNWKSIIIKSSKKPELSENSRIVLERRYLARNDRGETAETPEDMFRRVAAYVASADFLYGRSEAQASETANTFYELMAEMKFLPNSPTLMNAGRPLGQLSACFVLPVGTPWRRSSIPSSTWRSSTRAAAAPDSPFRSCGRATTWCAPRQASPADRSPS